MNEIVFFILRRKNMLQKFNKLAMCLVSAITITSAYPSEYIVIGASEKNKEKIYDIVSKFRFPSILSPFIQKEFGERYQNYNLIETFKTKEAEYKFLQTAIREIDNKAEVNAITKSEYQFTAYDYFDRTISVPKNCTGRELFKNLYEQRKKFNLSKYAKENEEWGLTRACSRFMADEKIKDIFWQVNDHAKNLYMKHKGKTEEIINEIFDAFQADNKSRTGVLDSWNLLQQKPIVHRMAAGISRMETMVGETSDEEIPNGWSEEKRQALKRYTIDCIKSEAANPQYVLYHGGNLDNPNPEIANRKSICLSDGLFSGYIFDAGASSYVYSSHPNKLYKLELDREKLLKNEYPIFIPPAFHLLSAAGNGELFHARTQVVQGVIDNNETKHIDEYTLSIKFSTDPIRVGFKTNQTPELYTTRNPQILLHKYNDLYEITEEGEFDKLGAERLRDMLITITEVPEEEITLR